MTMITLLNRHKVMISETVKVDDGFLCEMIVSLPPRRVGHTRERLAESTKWLAAHTEVSECNRRNYYYYYYYYYYAKGSTSVHTI